MMDDENNNYDRIDMIGMIGLNSESNARLISLTDLIDQMLIIKINRHLIS